MKKPILWLSVAWGDRWPFLLRAMLPPDLRRPEEPLAPIFSKEQIRSFVNFHIDWIESLGNYQDAISNLRNISPNRAKHIEELIESWSGELLWWNKEKSAFNRFCDLIQDWTIKTIEAMEELN